MALIGNRSVLHKSPMRFINGREAVLRSNFNKHGMARNAYEQFDDHCATPSGHLSPSAWVLAKTAGGLSSRNVITGASAFASSGALGVNPDASLSGSGDVLTANMQLVVSAIAALSGSGAFNSPEMFGKLEAAASLAGSGDLSGAIGALADLIASILGSGAVSSATPYASGSMDANIRGYSDLTPEGLRDSVWNALLAQYQDAGSAGKALSLASSGGIDYAALAAAILAAAAIDPISANVQKMNDAEVIGTGTTGDAWRGAGVSP